ncbi:MAG TPA: putative toxin-antitoxin system toxin component, PIN family [Ramlibacter sp.]|nr:putative toxin-antitoxin system toxin component, PIN family [Ramlibacter sp.]
MASDDAPGEAGGITAQLPLTLVLDTNIVLDLFIFDDAASQPLKARLLDGGLDWLATRAMRDELEHVLAYSHIEAWMARLPLAAAQVLARFDRHARLVEVPARAAITCGDPDDQMFIDLAVRHQCLLLSKDAAVLTLKKKLAALRVEVSAVISPQFS